MAKVHLRIEHRVADTLDGPQVTSIDADQISPDAGWLPGEGERSRTF